MSGPTSPLSSFVPRLVLEWAAERPEDRYGRVDGTLVFTDLSGFTAMSERMSRLGKLGAEELTVHLDATFSEMLRVAHHRGGSLLKFGGDALLIFFWGDDHVRRGVAAAQEMRATLRRVGRITTEAGKFRLRMSVGVHSGAFDLFLVGGSHRELVITGEAATTTVEMEGAADANEILLSPATAAALPPSCLGAPKGEAGGRLLRRKPSVTDEQWHSPVAVDGVDPTGFVPAALRPRLADPRRDAEHRQVTVTFVHFVGVDGVIADEGPEEAARRIDALVSFAQERFDEAGIAFLNIDVYDDGGKIFAQAGAPIAHENDDERMLRALRAIADEDFGLPVRIGVNRGYVFVGEIGTEYGRTYTAMGDAVNTAARVMARARPGQMLATSGVLERSNTAFDTTQLEPFAAKGKKQPLVAFDVGKITGVRERHDRTTLPLIGRDEELTVLLDALAEARGGRGRVIEIVADAGMGKSRLVDELADRAARDGARVVRVECQQYESATPYFPMRALLRQALTLPEESAADELGEALRHRVAELAPDLVPWLPLVGIPLGLDVPDTPETADLDDQFVKGRMNEVVADLLARALQEPIALVVEDGHWSDGASVDMLRHLENTVADRPWLLCVSRRGGESGFAAGDSGTTIQLRPLDAEAAARLARAAAPDHLLPQHVEALVARGAGNPMFVQRLSEGFLAGADIDALPDTVEAALLAEIDELEPEDRTLLRYASVLGSRFAPGVLAEVADDVLVPPEPDAWARLDHFVHPDGGGTLRFRHALYQDVAYEGLSYRRRRAMHQRIGEFIEADAPDPDDEAEALSLHFDRARDWERAFRYSKVAAQRARARYALTDAAVLYERAVQAGRRRHHGLSTVESGELLLDVSDMHLAADDLPRAADTCARARSMIAAGESLSRALLIQGEISDLLGDHSNAMRWYERAAGVLDGASEADHLWCRARIDSYKAATLYRQGRYAECLDTCDAAERASRMARDEQAFAFVCNYRYLSGMRLGHVDRQRHADRALSIFRKLGNRLAEADLLNNLAVDAYYCGDWRRAAELYGESETAQRRAGNFLGAVVVRHNAAEILLDQGGVDTVMTAFEEAQSVGRTAGFRALYLLATRNLARTCLLSGERTRARALFEEVLDGYRKTGAGTEVAETLLRLVELELGAGRAEDAAAHLDSVADPPTPVLRARSFRLRGLLDATAGDADAARTALHRSIQEARAVHAAFEEALTLHELSRVCGDDEATFRARQLFERLGVVTVPEIPLPVATA